jgi:N-methylhydantoinase B
VVLEAVVEHEDVGVEGDGHSHKPWGFVGGADGHTSKLQLIREGQAVVDLPSMLPTIAVAKGDRIRAVGGVGGGYGKASERPAAQVAEDVLDGYLTRESAARDFKAAIG